MSHRAGAEFFGAKRSHSRYKDRILDYYLGIYLEHVKRRPEPILLVDMFAGPGWFDGAPPEAGSPIIIAEAAKRVAARGKAISVLLVEKDKRNHKALRDNTAEYATVGDQPTERQRLARGL